MSDTARFADPVYRMLTYRRLGYSWQLRLAIQVILAEARSRA